MSEKPRLFLIDGHALAYRTYFALTGVGDASRWMTKAGEPTAGTYGFTSVLLSLLEQEAPEYLAVSFDTGKTFRDDMYPEYKATRDKMPDDLRLQIERIREVVAAFGIPILEAEGYEADDVLGTVAKQAAHEDVTVIILTGDRDLLQLVDESILIRLAGQKLSEAKDYGIQEVVDRYQLKPEQLIDYKAIVGDTSDNIPGVRGVGDKTAVKLLNEYQTLDEIYEHLEDVPTRFRNKLADQRDEAYLSRRLGQIVTDVQLDFDLEACRAAGYDRDEIVALFRELEFRTLLNRIPDEAATLGGQLSLFVTKEKQKAPSSENVIIVDTSEKLTRLVKALQGANQIAFDTETTSKDAMSAELVGISLAVEAGEGYYIPLGHSLAVAGKSQLDLDETLTTLAGLLTDPGVPKVGHNVKYDFIVLARHGLAVAPLAFDTMIAEWLCDPASRNLGLKSLAWVRLGIEMTEIQELIGSGKNQRSMADVPIEEAAPYAVADATVCLRLIPELQLELEEKNQHEMFLNLEMPLVPILAEMEMAGIALDTAFLNELSEEMHARIGQIAEQIYEMVGHEFNINSTQQLSKVLFDELGLDPPDRTRKTASGHYSTAAPVLDELKDKHAMIDLIREYREIAKLKSTYADALPNQVNPATGRVHTSYNQTGSVTGRLASSDPNLQNIPIRTELGRRIRQAFIPLRGNLLLAVDYSQIELRIVAHIAEDKAMIQAFLNDEDIHQATASAIYRVDLEDVTVDMRRHAKAVNFGLIYGMSPFGLSRSTDLTLAEAEDFVEAYFTQYPGVQGYLEKIRDQASEQGYVATLLGRRRYFPQLLKDASVSEVARSRAMREAINAPIQGTAADIMKIAMLKLPEQLAEAGHSARMLLQVHDELVFDCPENELEAVAGIARETMQSAFELVVPLKTDAKAGPNWSNLEPL